MVGNMRSRWKPGSSTSDGSRNVPLDLVANKGKALVMAGTRQPVAVHSLAMAINQALEAYGDGGMRHLYQSPVDESGTLAELKAAVDKGEVSTLVSLTPADPAYDAPGDFRWNDVRARLARVVHLGTRVNRTATEADLHMPGTHFLEAWGDVLDAAGVYSLVQPIILPLYNGTSEVQFLARLLAGTGRRAGEAAAGPPPRRLPPKPTPDSLAVRATFAEVMRGTGARAAWKMPGTRPCAMVFLARTGFAKLAAPVRQAEMVSPNWPARLSRPAPTKANPEFAFAADYSVFDGRYVNNAWMQEAPDPITKLTWDNAALMSPATAEASACTPRSRAGSATRTSASSRWATAIRPRRWCA